MPRCSKFPLLAAAATAALCAAAPARDDADEGWELIVTTSPHTTPRTCYPAPGLPGFLRGTYLIAGPAKFEIGKYKFQAIFDGFGKINRFELKNGTVCYTSAWMNTGTYRESESEGRPATGLLFEDTTPARPQCRMPMCNLFGPNDNNWVNMIPVGDEVLMLTDGPQMLRLDVETLNCSTMKAWSNDKKAVIGPPGPDWVQSFHTGNMGSAHPVRIPGTQTWVDIMGEMPEMMGDPWMDVYTFEGSVTGPQPRKKIGGIKTKELQYIHSFGVTQKHVVLTFNLLMHMNPMTASNLLGTIQPGWQGIYVMDFAGKWRSFATKPFSHVHTINTFENASGIVMDVAFYEADPFVKSPQMDIALWLNKTARDSNGVRSGIRRLHLHMAGPASGTVTTEDFVPNTKQIDFMKINPAYEGRPYCIYYAVEWWHDGKNYASMAVLKHNLCTGEKLYWHRRSTYMGEPMFVGSGASGATEDDGALVFVCLDGGSRQSHLVTVDARTMETLSSVKLPYHIPFTAHGHFLPAKQEKAASIMV